MDAGTFDGDCVLGRTGVDAGTTENTEIFVDRNIWFNAVALQKHCRNGSRQVNGTARADVNAGGAATGTFIGVEDDFSFKKLFNRDSLGRTDLFTPGTGDAEVLIYGNVSR